jgi:hypothetical protein
VKKQRQKKQRQKKQRQKKQHPPAVLGASKKEAATVGQGKPCPYNGNDNRSRRSCLFL